MCFRVLKPKFYSFVAVLGIVLSFAAVPVRLAAQEAAQAPTQTAVPAEKVKGDKPEAKSEEEEQNQFRHSASVAWVAKTVNLDVETTAKLFEFINFAVIALAIGIPLFRILPKAMRRRTAKLNFDIEVAQAQTADANARLTAVEAKLAGLDDEIAKIRKQVEEDIKHDEARAKAAIEEESARIVQAAEQEIAQAGAQAQRGLKQFAADLAIDRAMSTLTLSAETDHALIAEFAGDLAELSSGKRSKGGKN
jgi:F-type H+-transporting ATPase subunit b